MKRLIIVVPSELTYEGLEEAQKDAIGLLFSQWVVMPSTREYMGEKIIDAVVSDEYDESLIIDLKLPFNVIGCCECGEEMVMDEDKFLSFLSDVEELDEEGNVISSIRPSFHLPHSWAGW